VCIAQTLNKYSVYADTVTSQPVKVSSSIDLGPSYKVHGSREVSTTQIVSKMKSLLCDVEDRFHYQGNKLCEYCHAKPPHSE
jgi:hypothetical protein